MEHFGAFDTSFGAWGLSLSTCDGRPKRRYNDDKFAEGTQVSCEAASNGKCAAFVLDAQGNVDVSSLKEGYLPNCPRASLSSHTTRIPTTSQIPHIPPQQQRLDITAARCA